jgi:tetratricopeptide (TPR) repeat protein
MKTARFIPSALRQYQLNHLTLLAFGLLLAIVGSVAQWVSFPLALPVSGLALPFVAGAAHVPSLLSQGTVLAVLAALAAGFVLLGQRTWAAACLVAGTGIAAYAVAYIAFVEPSYVATYVQDSIQRSSLQRFLNAYFWANKDVEPSLTYLPSYAYLNQRLEIVWHCLGWGWMMAVIGLSLAVGVLYRTATKSAVKLWLPVSSAAVVLFVGIASGLSPVAADYYQRRGDAELSAGAYERALGSFERALRLDASLGFSEPFMTKVSKVYYQLGGSLDPYAQLHLAMLEIPRFQYEKAEFRLGQVRESSLPESVFKGPMIRFVEAKRADALLSKALIRYKQANLPEAAAAFEQALRITPHALHLQFFAARVYFDTRDYVRAARLIEDIVPRISSASVQADLYSTLGDAYLYAGDQKRAREAYFTSFSLDSKGNYRAVKALSGT